MSTKDGASLLGDCGFEPLLIVSVGAEANDPDSIKAAEVLGQLLVFFFLLGKLLELLLDLF